MKQRRKWTLPGRAGAGLVAGAALVACLTWTSGAAGALTSPGEPKPTTTYDQHGLNSTVGSDILPSGVLPSGLPTDTVLPSIIPSEIPLPTDATTVPTDPASTLTESSPPASTDDPSSSTVESSDPNSSPTATDSGSSSIPPSNGSGSPSSGGSSAVNPPGTSASGGSARQTKPHPHKPVTTAHAIRVDRPHPHRKAWPITLTIKTVPVLQNVEFAFDGHWVTTDRYGTATVTEEHNLTLHTLRIGDLGQEDSPLQFRFSRWVGQRVADEALLPTITSIPMRTNDTIYAGISVQYPVRTRIVTEQQTAVAPDAISSIAVRDDTGRITDLKPNGPTWLDGLLAVNQNNVLLSQPVAYSLQSVMVHGTNVVDSGRQRFVPSETSSPTFTALFFNLTITAHDAVFGHSLGDTADIRYPDGTTRTVALGSNHSVTVDSLPRGKYQVTVKAKRAVISTTTVNVSRPMTYDARAITWLDLLSILASALLVAAVLLIAGRTRWARTITSRAGRGVRSPRARGRRAPGRSSTSGESSAETSPLEKLLL